MKTLLALLLLAAVGAAFYFYHHPRTPETLPAPPPVASVAPPEEPPPAVPAPAPLDDRPLMALLRERCSWPMDVTLTRPHPVKFAEGEMTLPAGRKLKMTMLTDDGLLLCRVAELPVSVPFDATNFLDVLPAELSPAVPARAETARAPARPAAAPPAPEQALAALKARFPAAEKRKATVVIRNANQTHRRDTVELDIPKPDMLSRYRGWVMAATPASLPQIVDKLDAQLAQDLAALRAQYGSLTNQSANAEAYHTHLWLTGPMRSYVAQLRQIAGARR